jgi:hypothetical protein
MDPELLLYWAELRFGEPAHTTMECLRRAKTADEKEAAACVAILDLPDEAVRQVAGDLELAKKFLARRAEIVARLRERGVKVPLRRGLCKAVASDSN